MGIERHDTYEECGGGDAYANEYGGRHSKTVSLSIEEAIEDLVKLT